MTADAKPAAGLPEYPRIVITEIGYEPRAAIEKHHYDTLRAIATRQAKEIRDLNECDAVMRSGIDRFEAKCKQLGEINRQLITAKEQAERRDTDWVLAMAAALGADSGFNIPIVPTPEQFKLLFDAIAERRAEAHKADAEEKLKATYLDGFIDGCNCMDESAKPFKYSDEAWGKSITKAAIDAAKDSQ